MKKFIASVLSLLLLLAVLMSFASANENSPVHAHAEYTLEDDIISIKLSLRDIKDEKGIVCVDFTFVYNTDDYEFSSADIEFPDKWKPFAENENAESLSHLSLDKDGNPIGEYNWSLVMITPGYGITGSDELFCVVRFKVKNDNLSDIVINAGSIANDDGTLLENCNSPVVSPKRGTVDDDPTPDNSDKESSTVNGGSASTAADDSDNNNTKITSAETGTDSGSNTTAIIVSVVAAVAVVLAIVLIVVRRKRQK